MCIKDPMFVTKPFVGFFPLGKSRWILSLLIFFFSSMVCLCMSVVCMCVLGSCGSQRSVSGVFLSHCFRQDLMHKLDLMIQFNFLTRDNPISASPAVGLQGCALSPGFLHQCWGFELQVLMSERQALSPPSHVPISCAPLQLPSKDI